MKGNPFDDPLALQNSTLHYIENGHLAPIDSSAYTNDRFLCEACVAFRNLIQRPAFSCVGAKAAFNDEAFGIAIYRELASPESTAGLGRDLCHFAQSEIVTQNEFATFIAVFHNPSNVSEAEFEQLLWQQLDQLRRVDAAHFQWDARVQSDPSDPEFSFSFAGRAFYVLGMHAHSSRVTRRFPWPVLVFNPHEQFERLRRDGKWKRMQRTIRDREVALQGSINPMLSDFGRQSEARQYSGRAVSDDWTPPTAGKCPFAH
jgi:FPC/CPF motif-containing protein YcgG